MVKRKLRGRSKTNTSTLTVLGVLGFLAWRGAQNRLSHLEHYWLPAPDLLSSVTMNKWCFCTIEGECKPWNYTFIQTSILLSHLQSNFYEALRWRCFLWVDRIAALHFLAALSGRWAMDLNTIHSGVWQCIEQKRGEENKVQCLHPASILIWSSGTACWWSVLYQLHTLAHTCSIHITSKFVGNKDLFLRTASLGTCTPCHAADQIWAQVTGGFNYPMVS